MAHHHIPDEVPVRYVPRSRNAADVARGLFLVGLVAFLARLTQDPRQAWVSYVSNWLYFTSISMGGVVVAAATWITKSRWNWSVRRVSQAMAAFLPISFVMLLPMLGLRGRFFPWIDAMAHDPVLQKKAAYLNVPFLVSRNVVGLALLFGLALYFVFLAVRPDMGLAGEAGDEDPQRRAWRKRLTQGWMGQEQEEVNSYQRMTRLAPAIVVVYAVVMSVVAYDWVMSLEPHWVSTILAPWFFMGAFLGGVASTALWSLYLRTKDEVIHDYIGPQQRHDLGKLSFAFALFWAYLFFAQYLVIWYGKLPEEQSWIILRSAPPWGALSLAVVLMCFVVPFLGLIGRQPKIKPALLVTFTAEILVALWLERYVMVAPALWHPGEPVFTIWQPLIGCMFLGLYLGSIRWFMSTFPAIQLWQPMAGTDPVA